MPQLFPTFEPPEIVEDEQQNTPEYPKSLLFDFESGDFVLDGAGRLVETDGHTAWVQWCEKAVLTERFAFLVYGTDFGSELSQAKNEPNRAAVQSYVEREITEALLIDPRTEAVRDFAFSWSGDQLTISFTVLPVIGDPARLEVNV
ncbi:DUF2634 domain-containing protein [Paenibacillus alkalitolerans]|uniref:DUF2634 domain-containing protein n=1 Tax=Paenibacillus alkalitolerans TaxID=2799335 RepID=UPI0018F52EF0|nr:DUF2634 domain-containing protein [Paenibacillus alkalitolerans]